MLEPGLTAGGKQIRKPSVQSGALEIIFAPAVELVNNRGDVDVSVPETLDVQ